MNSLEGSTKDFDARLVIGPMQVGGLLSAALFGCLSCQSYVYFARFTNDSLVLKATVSAVILIQLVHCVCIISTLWTMTVSTYGDPSQLRVLPLAADLAIPLSAFTAFIVQSFYAFRLWKLTRNVFLPILCEIISVIAQISTLMILPNAFSMTDLTIFEDNQVLQIALALIARAVCDVITTTGMVWGLKRNRRFDIGHMTTTTTMIDRLIYWTVETGLATSLMAVTVAALFLALKQNFVWFGVWLMWPNVVGNSLLASLNRRLLLQETQRASAQSCGGGSLNMITFRAESIQAQIDLLENVKYRDVGVF
ncbi:hypothetical protein BDR05DRAFT_990090 [Suillus weaverae]|nr:hypothetical protein BDR05DRAFT_990090 [Suillus weaverae]